MSQDLSRNAALASPQAKQGTAIPVVNLPTKPGKIHIKEQKGRYQRLRTGLNSLLILFFFLLPFIPYQGRQAILLDVERQEFHFFSLTLWPQDFTLLAWLFIIAAFALFFVTVFWGRVWCGYLCPQTSWSFAFVWIERQIEGNSNKRHALDKAPWHLEKLLKRTAKHLAWGLAALITGCGFIAYFIPANELYVQIFTLSGSFWVSAWVWFFALCTYLNAGWMREQMCLHCCPYARFQSAMFDANTLTVSYDAARGESRGPRKRKQVTDLGDCVDCNLCVDVCPTGIDIRNGLQYECINCGACVDACDQTMDKFGYAKGLIRYASENELQGKQVKRFSSFKFVGYGVAVLIMLSVFALDLYRHQSIDLNVIRDRQSLYREVGNGRIENSYTLKIRNKTQEDHHYLIALTGTDHHSIAKETAQKVLIKAGEQLSYPVTVYEQKQPDFIGTKLQKQTIDFTVTNLSSPKDKVSQSSPFFSLSPF
ncbi:MULTISPECIES: cytochrome c oxidase accessory protein CcoG [Shewanella]|uniref:Cytochrome c oxidase accessory protein CcoG n=1 Tax=Shewanella marisflavi TaxID=260364 RepID=A0ABX5WL81_9GAMM|nr:MULTISPECIES: cytochrome c oxidase accessory protein CcoG [Shewanella]QDF74365.1 cytochrome c oxidase accessory protein CcoG [Shewanella marisflavi]